MTIGTRSVCALFACFAASPCFGSDDGQIIRLGGRPQADAMTLEYRGDAEIALTRGWRGGCGWRGPAWGSWGCRSFRSFGCFRPSFCATPAYYSSFYRPWGFGSCWPRWGWGVGYNVSPYYWTPSFCSTAVYSSYAPLSISVGAVPYARATVVIPGASAWDSVPLPSQPGGTYRYDGGPANPVPMPRAEPAPMRSPRQPANNNQVVSASTGAKAKERYTYLAYGENPIDSVLPQSNQALVFRVNLPATPKKGSGPVFLGGLIPFSDQPESP